MTPLQIEVLIHVYSKPCKMDNHDAPAVQEAFNILIRGKLITTVPVPPPPSDGSSFPCEYHGYATTGKGDAHVKQLCDLAFPVSAWVNGAGELINP